MPLLESKASEPQKKCEVVSKEDCKTFVWDIELAMTLLEAAAGSHFQERMSPDEKPSPFYCGCKEWKKEAWLCAGGLLPAGHSWAVKMSLSD